MARRRERRPALLAPLCLALLAACGPQLRSPLIPDTAVEDERAKQEDLFLELFERRHKRLSNVGARLRKRGAPLCGKDVGPYFGITWFAPEVFGEQLRDSAERRYGAGDTLRVFSVDRDSPAARAGVIEGDVLVALDGRRYSTAKQADEWLSDWQGWSLPLLLRRGEDQRRLTLQGETACRYRVKLVGGDAVNAFADGRMVGITTGMLRFVESDDELALVVGHELAHNALGHVGRQQGNSLAGALLGALVDLGAAAAGVNTQGAGTRIGMQAGGLAYAKDFEAEADYLGCYIAARAGYDISDAPFLWRRMAAEHPSSIGKTFMATHPSTPERATALERTIAEIRRKRERGAPLVPERLQAGD